MTGGKFQSAVDAAAGEPSPQNGPPEGAPLGGTKAEATQRLQIGLFGLGSMVLLIGLATIIGNQADITQESSVPEAAPTTEPTDVAPQRDPLADAGIVPDIPVEPEPETIEGVVEDLPLEDVGPEEGPVDDADEALQE
ncbi:hypothetical protein [uncultured Erythrobacter sp.]|uniref:hypothetical protein n=1 Tax=uncultured Erythrobacter sp. TaxID=263913 RepID=UPI002634E840|nr:hypothetical protein [uncultured Erythrobacter sp.]